MDTAGPVWLTRYFTLICVTTGRSTNISTVRRDNMEVAGECSCVSHGQGKGQVSRNRGVPGSLQHQPGHAAGAFRFWRWCSRSRARTAGRAVGCCRRGLPGREAPAAARCGAGTRGITSLPHPRRRTGPCSAGGVPGRSGPGRGGGGAERSADSRPQGAARPREGMPIPMPVPVPMPMPMPGGGR